MRSPDMKMLLLPLCLGALLAVGARSAAAQDRPERAAVVAKHAAAMASYDMLDLAAARQQLDEALVLARGAGLERDPLTAQIHLDLGVLHFAGLKDEAAARAEFAKAVEIDPGVEIGVGYRTEQMAAALAEVKQAALERPAGERPCAAIDGIEHDLVATARPGQPVEITARVAPSLGADEVTLAYRAAGATEFTRLPMAASGECGFRAEIPATAVAGETIHYFVAAASGGSSIDSRGSRGSPNVIEIVGGTDGEDPLADDDELVAGSDATLYIGLALGTGGAFVGGKTEVVGSDVGCCFAPALLHVLPELGFFLSRATSISLAFRLGLAPTANVDRHATIAPALLARVRHALDPSGEGLAASAFVGGGIIRNTVVVDGEPSGMDTDTTAIGPFLVGVGVGYGRSITDTLRWVAELNGLLAFTGGIETIGGCPGSGCVRPGSGFEVDLNLGVVLAF